MNNHWFWGEVFKHRPLFWRIIIAACMINFLSVASSIFIMVVYDRVIPNAAFASLFALSIGMGLVILFDFILKNLRAWFIDFAGSNIDKTVGKDVYNSVMRTQGITQQTSLGGLSNTIKDFDLVKDFFTSASISLVVDLPFIILFIFVIYLISGSLAFIPLFMVPLIILIGFLVQKPLREISEYLSLNTKSKHSIVVESLSGLETIQAAGAHSFFASRYKDSIEESSDLARKSKLYSQITSFAAGTAQQISLVAIIFFGTFLIYDGETSMGAMIAAVLLSSRALGPLAQIAGLFGRLHTAKTAYYKLDELMSVCDELVPIKPSTISSINKIEISNLSFGYTQDRLCLNNLSINISKGEKIAFLGKNGSGKSTLLKLLSGILRPAAGNIMFSGLPLSDIEQSIMYSKVGILLQEVNLFSGTVKENIMLGRDWINDADLAAAIEISGLKSFLDFLPGGLDCILADRGNSLSGGQRQSIALARAIANNPELLILDEPTASMDLNAENEFTLNLAKLKSDTTILIATHRLPIVNAVDRVVVIGNGTIQLDEPKETAMKKIIQKPQS
jgi:ATP-binding cassette subfamily C protein LapB